MNGRKVNYVVKYGQNHYESDLSTAKLASSEERFYVIFLVFRLMGPVCFLRFKIKSGITVGLGDEGIFPGFTEI